MPQPKAIGRSLLRSWGSVAVALVLFLGALIVYFAKSHEQDAQQRETVAEAQVRAKPGPAATLPARIDAARTEARARATTTADELLLYVVPRFFRNDFFIALLVACATQLMTTVLFARPFEEEIDTRLDRKLGEMTTSLGETLERSTRARYLDRFGRRHDENYLALIEEHCLRAAFYRKSYKARYVFEKVGDALKLTIETTYLVKNVGRAAAKFTPQLVYAKSPLLKGDRINTPQMWRVNRNDLLSGLDAEIKKQVASGEVHVKLTSDPIEIAPGSEIKVELCIETWRRDDDEENFVCVDPCDGLEVEVVKFPGLDIEIASICVGEFETDQEMRKPKPNSLVWNYGRPTLPLNGYQVTWRTAGTA